MFLLQVHNNSRKNEIEKYIANFRVDIIKQLNCAVGSFLPFSQVWCLHEKGSAKGV